MPDSRFTYAIGKLVLWRKTAGLVKGEERSRLLHSKSCRSAIRLGTLRRSRRGGDAIAQGLWKAAPKLVEGATIAQAYQFVETGNAELGFVALSQVTGPRPVRAGRSHRNSIRQSARTPCS